MKAFVWSMLVVATCSLAKSIEEKPIVIITASYNNARWYKRNIDSLLSQRYGNYKVLYTDDCSPDGTGALVEKYIDDNNAHDKIILTRNSERKGALANQHAMIHSCDDNAIITIVDGDDWLVDSDVLSYINRTYQSYDVWMTYGQFREWPSNAHGFNRPIPSAVIRNNTLRSHYYAFSHLRTYYAWLFKNIKNDDLMIEGEFLSMSGDIATMLPMAEMARDHIGFIPRVLYIYNGANDINDHKVSKKTQRDLDIWVRSRPSYAKLKTQKDTVSYDVKDAS